MRKLPSLKKINFFALIRYFYPLAIFIIVLILLGLFWFLYQNVYQTISRAQELTELKKEVSQEYLKTELFDQILERIKSKQELPNYETNNNINNPFVPPAPAMPTAEQ